MPRKRQYEIVNNSLEGVKQLNVDGREVKLGGNGLGVVVDEGLAKEIDARYGYRSQERTAGQVVVVPVDDRDPQQDKGFATYHRVSLRMRFRTIAEREASQAQGSSFVTTAQDV